MVVVEAECYGRQENKFLPPDREKEGIHAQE